MNVIRHLLAAVVLLTCARPVRADGNAAPEAGPKPTQTQRRSPSRALPVMLIAIGGVAVLGGTAAIVFDQDADPAPPGQKQRPRYFDSAPAGVVAITGGLIFAGVGSYLFWRHRGISASPSLTARQGGVVVGLSGNW